MEFSLFMIKGILGFLCVILLFAHSCKSKQDLGERSGESIEEVSQVKTPEILTISFSINSLDSIHQMGAFSNYGKLKERNVTFQDANEGDLKVLFLNSQGDICLEKIIPNPLLKKVEYSENDSSGILVSKAIEMEESEFFVRIQWDECIDQIQLDRIKEGNWKTLSRINFSKPTIQ